METRGHLATALLKEYITRDEEIEVSGLYQDLADMLRSFIEYLRRSDRRDRRELEAPCDSTTPPTLPTPPDFSNSSDFSDFRLKWE